MSVQFAPIPVRALTDARLNGSDFRLLGAIARYDRFGRNGSGCYVNARQLAQDAAIHYKHLGRQTRRLEAFGYITIGVSETDRRRNIYSVIYDESEIVTCAGDNSAGGDGTGDTVSPPVEKVTTGGNNPAEIVTNANSQVVDPAEKSKPKRLSEAYLRDPAKPRARNGENTSRYDTEKPRKDAWQGDRGSGESEPQGHLKWGPHALKGRNQPRRNQPSAPDWNGWIAYLATEPGHDIKSATCWIMNRIDEVKKERGCSNDEAERVVNAELKKRRKLGAAA